jgi:hypothetical protein
MKKKKAARAKVAKKSKPRKGVKAKAKTKPKVKAKQKAKARKPAKTKKAPPKPGVIAPPNSILLGYVEDYFAKIGVIALTLKKPVSVGGSLHVLGHTTNFEQIVDSMQIDHQPVTDAKAKDAVGIKVTARARRGDHVYLIP